MILSLQMAGCPLAPTQADLSHAQRVFLLAALEEHSRRQEAAMAAITGRG